MAASFVSKIV